MPKLLLEKMTKLIINQRGNTSIIVLGVGILVLMGFAATTLKYTSINRSLLRQRDSFSEDALFDYISTHTDCVKTQAQSCTDPLALLKRDGSVFLPATFTTIGPYIVRAGCVSSDGSIRRGYSKAGHWAQARYETLCVAP